MGARGCKRGCARLQALGCARHAGLRVREARLSPLARDEGRRVPQLVRAVERKGDAQPPPPQHVVRLALAPCAWRRCAECRAKRGPLGGADLAAAGIGAERPAAASEGDAPVANEGSRPLREGGLWLRVEHERVQPRAVGAEVLERGVGLRGGRSGAPVEVGVAEREGARALALHDELSAEAKAEAGAAQTLAQTLGRLRLRLRLRLRRRVGRSAAAADGVAVH